MLEELCRQAFFELLKSDDVEKLFFERMYPICKETEYGKARTKHEIEKKTYQVIEKEKERFFEGETYYAKQDWSELNVQRMVRSKDKLLHKCWKWFNTAADKIAEKYLKKKYGSNLSAAFDGKSTFKQVFEEFKADFKIKRRQHMEKTELAVAESKTKLAQQNQKPQSHGGVANLLKVLTKTMISEGASITAIAKVQYAVCIQAGIFIPNDFLVDVVVADEMIQEA